MTQEQSDFYAKSEGVHISLKQYDYLKSIERDVDKIKTNYNSENSEITRCFTAFVLNIKDLISEKQIHESMTEAGCSVELETSDGKRIILGNGSKNIKIKLLTNK